jgi:hypothetical protein
MKELLVLELAVEVATLFEDESSSSNSCVDVLLRVSGLMVTLEFVFEVFGKLVNHDAPIPRLRQVVDCSFEQFYLCVPCVTYDLGNDAFLHADSLQNEVCEYMAKHYNTTK